ncbi:MAG TPA: Uma2 family endonuclease [Methylomirabilota bacterium]|nr:Uma2 family endonuclease [Methylomirabilota bacterium]
MAQVPLTLRRWQRAEYDRLVDLGVFAGEPIELIGGQLLVAEPQGAYHASTVGMVDDALRAMLPAGWLVRCQAPLSLDDESEPEPDLAVVPGRRADYLGAHPSRPALLVEVADSSLAFDREEKGSLYARAGVADYWIVNLVDHVLEVLRAPVPEPTAPYGWRYASVERLGPTAAVTPLAFPDRPIAVSDLLPSRPPAT